MFGFLVFVLLVAAVWLLWTISRNTTDALDKQTALQYEIVALEKRLDELLNHLKTSRSTANDMPDVVSVPVEVPLSPSVSAVEVEPELPLAPVDLNQAELKDLTSLPRVGRALAQRIQELRPYSSVDDLLKVQGISVELLEELRPRVKV